MLVLSALGLLLALLGCAPAKPLALPLPISSWPGYEYFYLAHLRGLDRQHGLALQLREYPDPQDIVHAYLRGELPLAQLTTVEAVDLCNRVPQRCPQVVLVLDESLGGDQLVALPAIRRLEELKGRTVAVTPSTLGPYVLSRALQRAGLGLGDVRLQPMPLAEMPGALRRGEVQAAALFPPFSLVARREAGAHELFNSRQIPGEIFDVLVVDPQFHRAHRPAMAQLLQVWQAAHAEARRRPREALQRMAQREQISPEAFAQAQQGLRYWTLREQLPLLAPAGPLARNLAAVKAVQVQLGLVQPSSPLPQVVAQPLQEALR